MSLEQLLEDGVIDEVLGRLKSGKEADVWLVRHGTDVLCAKVYKDRGFRSFKNNAAYKEGRAVRNTRTQRAMDRGSRFGQAAAEEAWKSAESDALHKLHAQGVRVPAPVLFYEGILLMQLVLDAHGQPAPRLIDAQLTREEAGPLYADLRQQAVRMLCADLIHGDLSPYNVLLGAEGPTVIDFPQVVSAAHNSTAESFFRRDIENLRNFFAQFDPALQSRAGDAQEIWRAYVRRDLSPDFVPSGRVQQQRERHPQRQGKHQGQQPRQPQQQARQPQQQARQPQQQGRHPQQQARHPQQQARQPQEHARQPQQPGSHAKRQAQHPQRHPQHPHRQGHRGPSQRPGPVVERVQRPRPPQD